MAVVLGEPEGALSNAVLKRTSDLCISAGTLAEALIVAGGRGEEPALQRLLASARCEVVAVTEASARRCAEAYARWGKGNHRAKLNLGDCFAYELAMERRAPLLYVGNDFAQTDVESAIPSPPPSLS